ncbi:MAG: acetate kinase [Desulfobacterales bacterium]|nr:acetate kinase [Desulfobacterales bacterium]
MMILAINAGSSSIKFSLFNSENLEVLAGGLIERIGLPGTFFSFQNNIRNCSLGNNVDISDTFEAISYISNILTGNEYGVVSSVGEISAIGHRVVHGGESISRPVIISSEIKEIIRENIDLAPLHNPPNLKGIEACEKYFPEVPQVAVFDTAFHSSIPDYAYIYALPYRMYSEYSVRRYGFHGISQKYVLEESAQYLNIKKSEYNCIICHLGSGCSITAVAGGCSVDTSMGLTPLEGLVMGTRSGDIDPAVILYLLTRKDYDINEVSNILNKKSGLYGISGIGSSDIRDILQARDHGSYQAELAIKSFTYRVKKYICSYMGVLERVDSIVFTGGIGENSHEIRYKACQNLEKFGVVIDQNKNQHLQGIEIQSDSSEVKILVVPTNEEKEIARQVLSTVERKNR